MNGAPSTIPDQLELDPKADSPLCHDKERTREKSCLTVYRESEFQLFELNTVIGLKPVSPLQCSINDCFGRPLVPQKLIQQC